MNKLVFGLLTVSADVEDWSPANYAIGIVILSHAVCSVVLGPHFITDCTGYVVHKLTIETREEIEQQGENEQLERDSE